MLEGIRETITEVRDALVGPDRDAQIARMHALDALPVPLSEREQREQRERLDDERVQRERAERSNAYHACRRAILAVVPRELTQFRDELWQHRATHLVEQSGTGATVRRRAEYKITDRAQTWSMRPTSMVTNAGWLTQLAAVLDAAGHAAASSMPFLPMDELRATLAYHREQIAAALAREQWEPYPVEERWRVMGMPSLTSDADRPESW